jgi:hypothetical protein
MDHDEHDHDRGEPGPAAEAQPGSADGPPPAIDIERLAAKVRQLMLDDVRLEKARGAAVGRSRRGW